MKKLALSIISIFSIYFGLNQIVAAAENYYLQGEQSYKNRDFAGAANYFKKAFDTDNNNANAVYYQGLCYQQQGQYLKAKLCYQTVCEKFPSAPVYNNAMRALIQLDPSYAKSIPASSPSSPSLPVKAASSQDLEWARLPREATIPFTRGVGGHMFVNAEVNGRPMQVMFDTGAEVCHFGSDALVKAGVPISKDGVSSMVAGVGGVVKTTTMNNVSIKVGAIERHLDITVAEGVKGMPLLGETFFKDFVYDIDNRGGVIHFTKKDKNRNVAVASNDVYVVPFSKMGNNMLVKTMVNGRPCQMIFDTGAFGVCFSTFHLIALGINIPEDAKPIATGGVGGSVPGYQFEIDEIKLGPISKSHLRVVAIASMIPFPLLGQSFFGDRRFVIDNEASVIRFSH